jgi:thimet oligopeptidase
MLNKYFFVFLAVIIISGCSGSSDDFDSKKGEAPIRFPQSVTEIQTQNQRAVNDFKKGIDSIVSAEPKNFKNTIHYLNDILYDIKKIQGLHEAVLNLSEDESLRKAAEKSYLSIDSEIRMLFFNRDIYNILKSFAFTASFSFNEDKILIEKMIAEFKKNGADLSPFNQQQLEEASVEISSLESEFISNITNYNNQVSFTKSELEGLSESDLSNFDKDQSGNYIFDPRLSSQYSLINNYAAKEDTRKKAYMEFYSIAENKNPAILEKIIQLRAKKSQILGFDTYADFKISSRMAKTAENVDTFFDELLLGIDLKIEDEKQILKALKKQDLSDNDADFYIWDSGYYQTKYSKDNFSFNENNYKKYFSMEKCIKGMFEIFEEVFQIEINERNNAKQSLWHVDVKEYEMRDASNGELLGLFYFDLYPREGKFTHFATGFTYSGNKYSNGYKETASAILLGNWPQPSNNTPSLLSFYEVTTLFHEFGHLMNCLLMNSKYSFLRQLSWDFVEVPSQIAERWCYDQKILERFAVNWTDENDIIPADFIEKKEKSENAFAAMSAESTSRYSLVDLELHRKFEENETIDVDLVFNEEITKYLPLTDEVKNNTSNLSSFGHIAGGYDAGYYSYLWSLAIVHDFVSVFENSPSGFMDSQYGLSLRREIFEPGFSRSEDESVRAFLGRDWTLDAYINYINN